MNRIAAALLMLIFGLVAAGCGGEPPAAPQRKAAATETDAAPIDINRASAAELTTLKGIGEARAKAIIRGRPYARKDELVQRQIIPQSVYDKIKDRIIAKQK